MEQNEILENNRLIYDFMNEFIPPGFREPIEGVKYHTSLDWLSPVLDKIELILKDEGTFYMEGWNCSIWTGEQWITGRPSPESRTHAVYYIVCEFIKIYNERS